MPVQTRSRIKQQFAAESESVGQTRSVTPAPETPKSVSVPNAPKKGRGISRRIFSTESFATIAECSPLIEDDEEEEDDIVMPCRTLIFSGPPALADKVTDDGKGGAVTLGSPFHSPQVTRHGKSKGDDLLHTFLQTNNPVTRHESYISPDGQICHPQPGSGDATTA